MDYAHMMKILLTAIFLTTFQTVGFCEKIEDYPQDCITVKDKLEYGYIAQETLREKHNAMGQKYREGKISEQEWVDFKDGQFHAKQAQITESILEQKENLKASKRWTIDLDSL